MGRRFLDSYVIIFFLFLEVDKYLELSLGGEVVRFFLWVFGGFNICFLFMVVFIRFYRFRVWDCLLIFVVL